MKTTLKWIAALAGLLVGLVAVAAIVIPLLVDPNDFKPQIEQAVMEQSGRELRIEGDIGLSVFPWLGLELGAVQLNNPQGFGEGAFLRIEGAQVHVKLLPLLKKRLEVDTVGLQGLRLNLVRNKAGIGNWEGMAKPGGEAKPPQPTATGPAEAPVLEIGGITVSDAQAGFQDQATGARQQLKNLNLKTGELKQGQPFTIHLGFDLSSSQPALEGHVELSSTATLDTASQQYRLADTHLGVKLKGDTLPGGRLDASLDSNIAADMKAQTLQIAGLVLQAAGIRLSGDIQGKQLLDAPSFSGKLAVAEFNPRKVMADLGLTPPVTSDPEVLKRAKLDTAFSASAGQLALSEFKLGLDETGVGGSLNLDSRGLAETRFALNVDTIDLDRYLPPPAQNEVKQVREETPADAPLPIPVEQLRALNLAGSVDIKLLKAAKLTSRDVHISLKAKDGRIRVHPATARLYEGTYSGDLRLDVSGAKPQLSVNEHLAGIQASPLLKDMLDNERLAGTGNINASFNTRGLTMSELRAGLNGQTDIAFTDGAIKGVNIAQMIREAQAKFKGEQAPPAGANQTDFSELTATAMVTNGVLNNQDLSLKSPLLRISGAGKVDLVQGKIDYLLKTKITGALEGQGGKELDELKGLTIPVRISGDLRSPSYRPELDSVLKDKVEAEAKKKVEAQKEKLQNKLEDKLKKQFKLPF